MTHFTFNRSPGHVRVRAWECRATRRRKRIRNADAWSMVLPGQSIDSLVAQTISCCCILGAVPICIRLGHIEPVWHTVSTKYMTVGAKIDVVAGLRMTRVSNPVPSHYPMFLRRGLRD